MLPKNTYGSFDERPKYKAKQSFFRLTFLIPKILESLLDLLCKSLLESLRIKADEFLVESTSCLLLIHMQRSLGTVSALELSSQSGYSARVTPRAPVHQHP